MSSSHESYLKNERNGATGVPCTSTRPIAARIPGQNVHVWEFSQTVSQKYHFIETTCAVHSEGHLFFLVFGINVLWL